MTGCFVEVVLGLAKERQAIVLSTYKLGATSAFGGGEGQGIYSRVGRNSFTCKISNSVQSASQPASKKTTSNSSFYFAFVISNFVGRFV